MQIFFLAVDFFSVPVLKYVCTYFGTEVRVALLRETRIFNRNEKPVKAKRYLRLNPYMSHTYSPKIH